MKPKPLTFLLALSFLFLFSGCVSNDAMSIANETLMIPRDTNIFVTKIGGFSVDMSPRKVAHIVNRDKLSESNSNLITLQDIIVTNDIKSFTGVLFLEKKNKETNFYGDKSYTLDFCYGKLNGITEHTWILKSELENSKEADKRIFRGMTFDETGVYKPNEPKDLSSATIKYSDRSFMNTKGERIHFKHKGEMLYERIRSVDDSLRCQQQVIKVD